MCVYDVYIVGFWNVVGSVNVFAIVNSYSVNEVLVVSLICNFSNQAKLNVSDTKHCN